MTNSATRHWPAGPASSRRRPTTNTARQRASNTHPHSSRARGQRQKPSWPADHCRSGAHHLVRARPGSRPSRRPSVAGQQADLRAGLVHSGALEANTDAACCAMRGITCTAEDPAPMTPTCRPAEIEPELMQPRPPSAAPARQNSSRPGKAGVFGVDNGPLASTTKARAPGLATGIHPRPRCRHPNTARRRRSGPSSRACSAGCRCAGRSGPPRGWRSAACSGCDACLGPLPFLLQGLHRRETSTCTDEYRRAHRDSGWRTKCHPHQGSPSKHHRRRSPISLFALCSMQRPHRNAGTDDQHIKRVCRAWAFQRHAAPRSKCACGARDTVKPCMFMRISQIPRSMATTVLRSPPVGRDEPNGA